MAMYLLIEFDKDDQADEMLQRIQTATKAHRPFRAVGLFKKPTKFCECPPMTDLQVAREVTRGALWGIWVHRACRRARKAPQAPRNLLEGERVNDRNFFLNLTPNYPLTVHNVRTK